jgi:hypothetical protein
MNKEQQLLIDKAYENYYTFMRDDRQWELDKEEFIEEIKTDTEFSEKWGLTIEERELSDKERVDIFNLKMIKEGIRTQIPTVGVDESYWKESLEKTKHNIPTKLIIVTYQDQTIESYE